MCNNMKTYCLEFKPLGPLSQIPDAQKIFGYICTVLKYTKGEEALQDYLHSFSSKPLFVHSSMMVQGLLPMVKIGLVSISQKNKDVMQLDPSQQLNYLSKLKKYKKVSYMTEEVYNQYIVKNDFSTLKEKILNQQIGIYDGVVSFQDKKFDIRKEMIYHNNLSTEQSERGLYYDNNIYCSKDMIFNIYVKTDNIDFVQNIFKYSPYFAMGNRGSVGKNMFEFLGVKEIENNVNDREYVMLLSKAISSDDDFDLTDSHYMIESTVYSGSKYYSSNSIGRFNEFLPGSYMKVNKQKEYYGKVIKTNNGKDIYHYSIGFVL